MLTKIKAVRVQEVIVSGSSAVIGNIKYNNLEQGKPLSTKQLPVAKPLFTSIKQLPTVNEIVYIVGGPKEDYNTSGGLTTYYFPHININGASNHNAQPSELFEEELEAGVETSLDYFQEINNIRPLLPYLGDTLIEGRYGQSIRFGSTINTNIEKGGSDKPNNWSNEGNPGSPITIIRNGQTEDPTKPSFEHILEDINKDNSSIYLCSNQQISNFQKAGISPNDHPPSYKHML